MDSYLLETHPRDLRSEFGMLLRGYIEKKKLDPEFKVPYIPGTRTAWKTKKEKEALMRSVIWKPPEIRYKDDTKYYFDRYDVNAPPRPEPLRKPFAKNKKGEFIDMDLDKEDLDFSFDSGIDSKDLIASVMKQFAPPEEVERKKGEKVEKTVVKESRLMKRLKAKFGGSLPQK